MLQVEGKASVNAQRKESMMLSEKCSRFSIHCRKALCEGY